MRWLFAGLRAVLGAAYLAACVASPALAQGSGNQGTGSLPLPVINGDCLLGSTNNKAVWGSCSGGAAVASVTGTAGQVTASPTTGSVIVGLPATITANETFSGTINFTGTAEINGTAFGTAATQNTGTSGANLGLLNGNLTFGGNDTFSGSATLNGTVSGTGITNLFASPPAIGGSSAAAGNFTTLGATGNLTTNITGSTQCVHVNSSGVASGTGSDCSSGGGSVSVTAGTPNIVITPSPGTGTFTVGSTETIRAQTTTSDTLVTGDNTKFVVENNAGAIAASLAQAGTAGFASGWSIGVGDAGAGATTITTTTSKFLNKASGASTLFLPTGVGVLLASDGTDYVGVLGVPPYPNDATKFLDGAGAYITAVTSIATTSPITGGTITTTGTIACATCVVASSPGVGIAHFAGSTQTVTSSLIVAADITSATITGTQIASSVALAGSPTTTTQSAKDNSTKIATTAYVDAPTGLTAGSSVSLAGPRQYFVCTTTCTVTPPVPAAGYEFCVMNDDNVSTVITLAALGSSARYENTARTAYGTAGTGTFVSGGAAADKVCIVGRDSTHYLTTSFNGSWTAN